MKKVSAIACLLNIALLVPACGDDGSNMVLDADAGLTDAAPGVDAAPPPPSCALSNQDDPLCALNSAFRAAYAQHRAEVVAVTGPIILSIGGQIVLLRNGQREEVNAIGDFYHEVKSISHAPLAIYTMLANHTDASLPAATATQLESFRALTQTVRDTLNDRGFTPEQLTRQERLLDGALTLIDQVLEANQITAEELTAYTRMASEDVLTNVRDAAIHQLENTHMAVDAWLSQMSDEERASVRVVVANAHMPRKGSVTGQYFTAAIGDPYEGKYDEENISATARMIAAENVWDETGLLDLLGTHLVDGAIGVAFFDDYDRMHRDLLADVAEEWIVEQFGITAEAVCTPSDL